MKVEIRKNPLREEPAVIIETPVLTAQVEELARRLEEMDDGTLVGYREERTFLLETARLVCLYGQDKGVFARNEKGEVYALRLRLYELEERLDGHTFVRISHSEIINLKKVTALDLKLSGTIRMTLKDGTACYVSRRYVKKIKEVLGI